MPNGLVSRISISYSAPCQTQGARFPNVLQFAPGFKILTPVLVTDHASFSQPLKGGGKTSQIASVVAHFANGRWSGTFRTRAILTRNGHRLDKCQLRKRDVVRAALVVLALLFPAAASARDLALPIHPIDDQYTILGPPLEEHLDVSLPAGGRVVTVAQGRVWVSGSCHLAMYAEAHPERDPDIERQKYHARFTLSYRRTRDHDVYLTLDRRRCAPALAASVLRSARLDLHRRTCDASGQTDAVDARRARLPRAEVADGLLPRERPPLRAREDGRE